jgi:hypothetical protein
MIYQSYCITLFENQISKKLADECVESGKRFSWPVNLHPGVPGHAITDDTWKEFNINPPGPKKFRTWPAMQGCFLSHFSLWKKCYEDNIPLIVFEHDALIVDFFEIEDNHNLDLIKLHSPIEPFHENSDTGIWEHSAHAYLLYPPGAKKLVDWVEKNYAYNPDIIIGSKVLNWGRSKNHMVGINPSTISLTTKV